MSVQALTTTLQTAKTQLIQMNAEKLELSPKLDARATEADKKLEELAGVRGARERVDSLMRFIVDQSVAALDVFIDQVDDQLWDPFRTGQINAYAGGQLLFPHTLTHVSGVDATSVEVQIPISPGGEGGGSAATNPSALVPPKPSTPPAKASSGRSKKARH